MLNPNVESRDAATALLEVLERIDKRLTFDALTRTERDLLTLAANNVERAITAMFQAQRHTSNKGA